ncbi:MAG: inositol phosphorylceramide synthase [Actinobacteria bacterium]|nr:MAG: inositol phosphorylceramide synthase [Actinomycetota bacterium]
MVDAVAPPRRRVNPWIVARWMAFAAYFVVFVWFMGRTGIPFDRERLLLWIVGGLVVVSIGRPWRTLPRMFLDWSIFIVGITLYDFARGAARFVDAPIQVTPQAEVDKIFGLGQIPTVWLQENFLHAKAHWWDAAASIIYATHFILPFVVAGVLWAKDRVDWRWFASRFLVLCFLGCVTYAIVPTAPPWYASQIGEIGDVVRSTGRGWQIIHINAAETLIKKGQLVGNAFAAIPSLHAAWAALVATAVWRRVKGPVRWAVFVYPAAMALTLVYTGEHYFIDAVVGWLYLAGICFALPRIEDAWRRWRHPEEPPDAEPATSGLPSSADAVMAASVRDLPSAHAPGGHEPHTQPSA